MAFIPLPLDHQYVDTNGTPYSGAVLKCYLAGGTTVQTMYTDKDGNGGATSFSYNAKGIPQTSGGTQTALYIDDTLGDLRFILYPDSTDAAADDNSNALFDIDAVPVRPALPSLSSNAGKTLRTDGTTAEWQDDHWIDYGHTPTQTSGTTFTVTGDQTSIYTSGRRIRSTDASTIYDSIVKSEYSSVTTVTVLEGGLTGSLSAVALGPDPKNSNHHESVASVLSDGAVIDGDGSGGGTDSASAIQTSLDRVRDYYGRIQIPPRIFRCDSALTLQNLDTSPGNWVIDMQGATFDFSASGLTSGNLFTVGADSASNGHDKEILTLKNLSIIGPEPALTTTNTTTCVGMYAFNALNTKFENIKIKKCYKGVHTKSSWHIHMQDILSRECYIGYHLDDDCTFGTWIGAEAVDDRYGLLIQPGSAAVTGQKFISFRNEGNDVGIVLDPHNGSGIAIQDIDFDSPYFENITYDLIRVGLQWTFATPETRNADSSNNWANLHIKGGHWSTGAYTATHAPIVFDTAGNGKGGSIEIPALMSDIVNPNYTLRYQTLVNGTTGLGMDVSSYLPGQGMVVFAGADGAVSSSIGPVSSVTRNTTGDYSVELSDSFTGGNAVAYSVVCTGGYADIQTDGDANTLHFITRNDAGTAIDPNRVRVMFHGILT